MALLRDNAGRPADIPVHVDCEAPERSGVPRCDAVRAAEDAVHLPVKLSNGAPVGTWTIEVKAETDRPPIGRAGSVSTPSCPTAWRSNSAMRQAQIIPGKPYALPVAARFLYGAPAAGLTGQAQLRLVIDPAPFPALAGYRIGLIDETYAPDSKDLTGAGHRRAGRFVCCLSTSRAPRTRRTR